MLKIAKLILIIIPVIFISMITSIVLFSYNTGDVILIEAQPDSVEYDAHYYLRIKEGNIIHRHIPTTRYVEIVISRDQSFTYGHMIQTSVLGGDINNIKVEWLASGVNLKYESGHILFIPKSNYEGGR